MPKSIVVNCSMKFAFLCRLVSLMYQSATTVMSLEYVRLHRYKVFYFIKVAFQEGSHN